MKDETYGQDYFTSDSKLNDYGPDLPYDWEHREGQMKATLDDIKSMCLPFRSVLDVGCGTGLLVRAMVNEGTQVQGIDISHWAISNCDEKAKGLVHIGDARDIRHADESFDLVVALDTLEHLEITDASKALGELCRVARHEVVLRLPCSRSLEWVSTPDPGALAGPTGDETHKSVVPVEFWQWEFQKRGWLIVCQMNAVALCMLPRNAYIVARKPEFQYEGKTTKWDAPK